MPFDHPWISEFLSMSDASWPDLMWDLAQVQAVDLELDGQRYRLRTDLAGAAYQAFAAAGVRPPAAITHLGGLKPPPPKRRTTDEDVVPRPKVCPVTHFS